MGNSDRSVPERFSVSDVRPGRIEPTDYGAFIERGQRSGQGGDDQERDRSISRPRPTEAKPPRSRPARSTTPIWSIGSLRPRAPTTTARSPFRRSCRRRNSPILNFLLMWILPGLLFYILWKQASRSIQARMGSGGNFLSFGNGGAKIYADSDVKATFADVAGQDEAKEALDRDRRLPAQSVEVCRNRGLAAERGAAGRSSGNGQDAHCAGRSRRGPSAVLLPCRARSSCRCSSGWAPPKSATSSSRPERSAPCIIFIDEIDAIGKRRDTALGGNDEREQTLNQLLTEMDGFRRPQGRCDSGRHEPSGESRQGVAASGGASTAASRWSLPDLEGRKAILRVHLARVKHEAVDLSIVAQATAGSSGAELANIVNEAALRAVRQGVGR